MARAIEGSFPTQRIDRLAEKESYRKEVYRPPYHVHKWWAKRLGSVFRAIVSGSLSEGGWHDFYQEQDFSGTVVLDPFMGSGTTLGEALKVKAKVVGCDVNPVSTFLVREALTNVDLDLLRSAFADLENGVRDRILSYYQTELPSGYKTTALYYFWVKLVRTPEGEEIPLFSSYVFSKNAYPSRKPNAQVFCPHCETIFACRYDSRAESCPSCGVEFDPQDGPVSGSTIKDSKGEKHKIKELVASVAEPPAHKLYAVMAINEHGEKSYFKPTATDFAQVQRATTDLTVMRESLPLPTMHVRDGFNTNQAIGYNYKRWEDFFSNRQLLCLGLLLESILSLPSAEVRKHFICLFSGVLEFNNLFCSFKGEGTGAVRHMFSNHILKPERQPLENTVWGVNGKSSGSFEGLFKTRLLRAKEYLVAPFEIADPDLHGPNVRKVVCSPPIAPTLCDDWDEFEQTDHGALVLNGDSARLSIPDHSIDAVVTDPPYFDFVNYSELSDFFYAWISGALGSEYAFLSRPDSSHTNEVQDRSEERFSEKLASVFSECGRVLKQEGVLCFSFHHSRISGWSAIYEAIGVSGFSVVAAHPIKAEMSGASPKSAAKDPINLDAILVCKKVCSQPKGVNLNDELRSNTVRVINEQESIRQTLSSGDRFVIACSQALVVASKYGLTTKAAKGLMNESVRLVDGWLDAEIENLSEATI